MFSLLPISLIKTEIQSSFSIYNIVYQLIIGGEVITGVVDQVNFTNEYFLNIIGNNFHISKLHEKLLFHTENQI